MEEIQELCSCFLAEDDCSFKRNQSNKALMYWLQSPNKFFFNVLKFYKYLNFKWNLSLTHTGSQAQKAYSLAMTHKTSLNYNRELKSIYISMILNVLNYCPLIVYLRYISSLTNYLLKSTLSFSRQPKLVGRKSCLFIFCQTLLIL